MKYELVLKGDVRVPLELEESSLEEMRGALSAVHLDRDVLFSLIVVDEFRVAFRLDQLVALVRVGEA